MARERYFYARIGRGTASFRGITNWTSELRALGLMKGLDRTHEGLQTDRMNKSSNTQTREVRQKKLAEALRANLRRRKSSGITKKPDARGNR